MTIKNAQRNIDVIHVTADERRIEGFTDQSPPDFAPTEFALIHDYYTPVAVAEAVADLICPVREHAGLVRTFEPSVGIGRLVRALGRKTRHHDH